MRTKAILALTLLVAGLFAPAEARERLAAVDASTSDRFLAISSETRAPIGWVEFCRNRPSECRSAPIAPQDVALTPQRWTELVAVNRDVNARIAPATDMELYGRNEMWTYPESGKGDCEDYALLKRRMLIERGWPESALLMTVVRDHRGDGHAVLMVRTSGGDVILDNVVQDILPWYRTGYRFVRRQSQWAPNVWVSLPHDTGSEMAVAARR